MAWVGKGRVVVDHITADQGMGFDREESEEILSYGTRISNCKRFEVNKPTGWMK